MQLLLPEGYDCHETGAEVPRGFSKASSEVEESYKNGGPPDSEETLPEAGLRKALYSTSPINTADRRFRLRLPRPTGRRSGWGERLA